MITKFEAIRSLEPTASFSEKDGVVTWIDKSVNQPSDAEIQAEITKLQAEWDSKDYARKRKAEYDQLNQYELMFDDKRDGSTTWVDKINEIKSRYPK